MKTYRVNFYYLLIPCGLVFLMFLFGFSLFTFSLLILMLAAITVRYYFYEVQITEQSLVIVSGILFKHKQEIFFSKINNMELEENIIQHLFKTGNILLMTGNDSAVYINSMANYPELLENIRSKMNKNNP
jgi:uncharacterized membrane protein YdbT with pleckstrin-like domain